MITKERSSIISNIEILGRDGQYVYVTYNSGDTTVLSINEPIVKEYISLHKPKEG